MATILYIDDSNFSLALVKLELERNNPDFLVVTHPIPPTRDEEAVTAAVTAAVLRAQQADVVLLDYTLGSILQAPDILPFFERLGVPVVVFSGWLGGDCSEDFTKRGIRTVDKAYFGNGALTEAIRAALVEKGVAVAPPSSACMTV